MGDETDFYTFPWSKYRLIIITTSALKWVFFVWHAIKFIILLDTYIRGLVELNTWIIWLLL